jgi:hypothetical protein
VESDSIRSSGSNTLVDIWIDGKFRSICVSREAIDTFLGFERGAQMSDHDRCEFVKSHLKLVIASAKTRLAETGYSADSVVIDAGQLRGPGAARAQDRRSADRRKGDRRKVDRPASELPFGDRRRSQRRQSQRRRSPKRES